MGGWRAAGCGLALGLAAGWLSAARAGEAPLVVLARSDCAGQAWLEAAVAAARQGLEGAGARVELVDLGAPGDAAAWKAAGQAGEARLAELRPAVVVGIGDSVQRWLVAPAAARPGAPAFVFCGVLADPAVCGLQRPNVTGVRGVPFFIPSLELLKSFVPSIRRVAVLTDGSTESEALLAGAKDQDAPVEALTFDQVATWAEWQAAVTRSESVADALAIGCCHGLRDAGGAPVKPEEVLAWTAANARLPTLGFWEEAVLCGVMCGVVADGAEQGRLAVGLARDILGGQSPAALPVVTPARGRIMFNLKTARGLGVEVPFELVNAAARTVE